MYALLCIFMYMLILPSVFVWSSPSLEVSECFTLFIAYTGSKCRTQVFLPPHNQASGRKEVTLPNSFSSSVC